MSVAIEPNAINADWLREGLERLRPDIPPPGDDFAGLSLLPGRDQVRELWRALKDSQPHVPAMRVAVATALKQFSFSTGAADTNTNVAQALIRFLDYFPSESGALAALAVIERAPHGVINEELAERLAHVGALQEASLLRRFETAMRARPDIWSPALASPFLHRALEDYPRQWLDHVQRYLTDIRQARRKGFDMLTDALIHFATDRHLGSYLLEGLAHGDASQHELALRAVFQRNRQLQLLILDDPIQGLAAAANLNNVKAIRMVIGAFDDQIETNVLFGERISQFRMTAEENECDKAEQNSYFSWCKLLYTFNAPAYT